MVFKLPQLFSSSTNWLERQQGTILSAAVIITIANAGSSLSGLIRQRLLLSLFYNSPATQKAFAALIVAFQIPDLMFQMIVLGAVSAAFIPVFTSYKQDPKEQISYMNYMMNGILLSLAAVAILVFIFAVPITRLRTGAEFDTDQVIIAANLTRIMLGAQFFFAISNFLTGMLQAHKRFLIPAISPILYNIGILFGSYLLAPYFGIYAAGIGVVFGALLHTVVQIPLAFKLGFRFQPKLSFRHPGVRTTYKLTPARTATLGISQIQDLASAFFATSIDTVGVVVVNLGSSLMTMPIRFFGTPISQAALPFLSDEAIEKDLTHFRDLVLKSIHQIAFLTYPASVLLLILKLPIVRLAFGTPDFPWKTTLLTADFVAIISLSITSQAIVTLLVRAFHALHDTRTPFYITIGTVAAYIGISILAAFTLHTGVSGLAWAITISSILEMLLFLFLLDRRVRGFAHKAFWIPQLKMITASFLMAVFLFLPFRILDVLVFNTSRTIELILLTVTTGTIGMLVYIYFAMLFDIRELYMIKMVFTKIGSWQKTLFKSQEVLLDNPTSTEEVS